MSRAGATPLAWTLDHIGPMARSAEDLALLLAALAGHDPGDPASAHLPVPDYPGALEGPLGQMRIGVPRAFAVAAIDAEVGHVFEEALGALRAAGAAVCEVALPALDHAVPALAATILAEANAALRPLLGSRIERVSTEVRVYLELGKTVTAESYLAAQRLRTVLYEEARRAFARVDLLALPATVLPAPRASELRVRLGGVEVGVIEAISRLTAPANLTGLPALVVPCGFTSRGLPVGLQLVGRPFAEAGVLAAGHAYQRITDWHLRRPPRLEAATG